jgi:hypothetical protein
MDAKHKEITGNNQDFFFCLYPKAFRHKQKKVMVVPDYFFMVIIQDN